MEILTLQKILFFMGALALLGAAVIFVTRPTREYRSSFLMIGIAGIMCSILGSVAPYIEKWASNNIEEAVIIVGAIWIVLVVGGVVNLVAGIFDRSKK